MACHAFAHDRSVRKAHQHSVELAHEKELMVEAAEKRAEYCKLARVIGGS